MPTDNHTFIATVLGSDKILELSPFSSLNTSNTMFCPEVEVKLKHEDINLVDTTNKLSSDNIIRTLSAEHTLQLLLP